MRRMAVACLVFLLSAQGSSAQVQKFPFEAIVDVPEAYVRSGPGERFYPTGKLRKGSRVTVVRKDFGGWFMIQPPQGSFSWVRADYVNRTGEGTGSINADNVVARVGSNFGEVRDVEQRRLSSGDLVEILGEAKLDNNGTPTLYFKVKPPKGEYRWILGEAVVAEDAAVRQEQDSNPFEVPSQVRRSGDLPVPDPMPGDVPASSLAQSDPNAGAAGSTGPANLEERPVTRFQDQQSVRRTVAPPEKLTADRDRLGQLDGAFREMIRQDTSQWDFAGLEAAYRQLHETVASPALRSQIELRFPALDKYKRIKQQYDDFVLLTRETEQRDAQLLSMQNQPTSPGQPERTQVGATSTPSQAPAPTGPGPSSPGNAPLTGSPQAGPSGQTPPAQRPHPKFVGAGVVQRLGFAPPGRPQFVLVAPDGRLLAYLQGEGGVDLNQYVGHSMGLEGRRWHRPELGGDFILVRNLTPVRLKTPGSR